jgi:hypothetical protein
MSNYIGLEQIILQRMLDEAELGQIILQRVSNYVGLEQIILQHMLGEGELRQIILQ